GAGSGDARRAAPHRRGLRAVARARRRADRGAQAADRGRPQRHPARARRVPRAVARARRRPRAPARRSQPRAGGVRRGARVRAERGRLWNDVVAVESALVERAATDALRLAALRRKAQVIEDQLKDAPRAFRTHLVAFLIAPDDGDTTSHLWRLARVIGRYRDP